ncbi:hypothetical protein V6N13_048648 [Hibiscus sabdariffa]
MRVKPMHPAPGPLHLCTCTINASPLGPLVLCTRPCTWHFRVNHLEGNMGALVPPHTFRCYGTDSEDLPWHSHLPGPDGWEQCRAFLVNPVEFCWCMTRGNPNGPLLPSEPEVEQFFRQRRRTQRAQNIMYALGYQGVDQVGGQYIPYVEANGNGNGNAEANGNAARPRAIRDHLNPILEDLNPGIVAPEIQVGNFELKPVMFNMLNSIGQFGGMPHEDARQHIHNFLEVCDSFRQQGVHEDVLKLKLFP